MIKNQNQAPGALKISDFADKSLLILDDDDPFRGRLARAMEKKGFSVKEAKSVQEGLNIAQNAPTNFAVIDLRLEDGNGLDVVKTLNKSKKDCRIVMLTGYGNLPTAVAAVKAGCMNLYSDLIKYNMVDAIVATGASIIDMDFFEALGFKHYQGSQFQDDTELRNNYIDRIYDTYIDEEELQACDKIICDIANSLKPRSYTSREFIKEIGKYLKDNAKK